MKKYSVRKRIEMLDKLATKLHLYSLATDVKSSLLGKSDAELKKILYSETGGQMTPEKQAAKEILAERAKSQGYTSNTVDYYSRFKTELAGKTEEELNNIIAAADREAATQAIMERGPAPEKHKQLRLEQQTKARVAREYLAGMQQARREVREDSMYMGESGGLTQSQLEEQLYGPTGVGDVGLRQTRRSSTPATSSTPAKPAAPRPAGATGGKYKSIDPNMQRALGVTPDGVWGPETQRAIERKRAELKKQYPGTEITDQIVSASLLGQSAMSTPSPYAPVTSFQPVTPTPFNPNEP